MEHPGTNFETYPFQNHTFSIGTERREFMRRSGKSLLAATWLAAFLIIPCLSMAADQDVQQKLDSMAKEIEALKKQVSVEKPEKAPGRSIGDWLTIGGDYRFRIDSLRGKIPDYFQFNPADPFNPIPVPGFKVKNDILYTNRFGLDLKAKATRNVSVTSRLLMYKAFGNNDSSATSGTFFADRIGVFDGTEGHVPNDGKITVDTAYATWSNILDHPVWFSVGRRPSTGGIPSHLRQNKPQPGQAGIPAILVDYAFDGMTLGWAPDIEALPGAYGKICYGRGFENGIKSTSGNGLHDTDMLGVSAVPYDTDPLHVSLQWNRGFNIFDSPVIARTTLPSQFSSVRPLTDLGDIDWYQLTLLSVLKDIGPGRLNLFGSGGLSITHPNTNTNAFGGGLLFNDDPLTPGLQGNESKTGWAAYIGARYDFNRNRTKLGLEFNHGSKDWITFTPAADDMWTSKLGTRGNVYEAYLIQEFNLEPISSYLSKTFAKIGYQYYDFDYTGSNNWVGAPVRISDLKASPLNAQFLTPLSNAQDIYATLEVHF